MLFKPFQIRYLGYWLVFLMLLAAGMLDLATPLLAVLFSYFVLTKLRFGRSKLLPATIFIVLVLGVLYVSGYFIKQAVDALPNIVEESIPKVQSYLQSHGWGEPPETLQTNSAISTTGTVVVLDDLPDETLDATNSIPAGSPDLTHDPNDLTTARQLENFKKESVRWLRAQLGYLGNFAKIATKEFAFLIIGVVVAISLFFNSQMDLDRGRHPLPNNLYSFACDEVLARFRSFYQSFDRVMGAQIIISILNTGFTAVYLLAVGLPYAALVICITFLCGLLPIVGNLISNTIIVALSFRVSPQLAVASLIYLVVLHKLEYFLNSKIIGDRIKNPVWLTLLGLIIGERLMGIPGMILAPVLLNFVKVEASTIPVPDKLQREKEEDET
jgi:predicted PurR-regulated permease PerM